MNKPWCLRGPPHRMNQQMAPHSGAPFSFRAMMVPTAASRFITSGDAIKKLRAADLRAETRFLGLGQLQYFWKIINSFWASYPALQT